MTTSLNELEINQKPKIYWFFYRLPYRIKDAYYETKYAFQRLFRGYEDPLLYNLGSYITKYSLLALKDMLKNKTGYPVGISEEVWNGHLNTMIAGFEVAKLLENHFFKIDEYEDAYTIFENGMDLFKQYYFHLWD